MRHVPRLLDAPDAPSPMVKVSVSGVKLNEPLSFANVFVVIPLAISTPSIVSAQLLGPLAEAN